MAKNEEDFRKKLNKIFEDEAKNKQAETEANNTKKRVDMAFLSQCLEVFEEIREILSEHGVASVDDESSSDQSISLNFENDNEIFRYILEVADGTRSGYRVIREVNGIQCKTHKDDADNWYVMNTSKEAFKEYFLNDFRTRHEERSLKFQHE